MMIMIRRLGATAFTAAVATGLRWGAGGMALAALALAALGPTPGSVSGGLAADAGWALPDLAAPALDVAESIRRETPLWGSQPAEAPPPEAGPAPPPKVIAVFRTPAGAEAVFLSPQGQRRRAVVGATLDGGFVVEAIEPTRVRLRADDGRELDQRLLDAPVPTE